MMSVAAGISTCGKTVFASSFAMFAAGRAFEQIRNSKMCIRDSFINVHLALIITQQQVYRKRFFDEA